MLILQLIHGQHSDMYSFILCSHSIIQDFLAHFFFFTYHHDRPWQCTPKNMYRNHLKNNSNWNSIDTSQNKHNLYIYELQQQLHQREHVFQLNRWQIQQLKQQLQYHIHIFHTLALMHIVAETIFTTHLHTVVETINLTIMNSINSINKQGSSFHQSSWQKRKKMQVSHLISTQ
jgi:hypothetical protein